MKAVTQIKHNGEIVAEPGETITKSGFSQEEWDALVESGSVAENKEADAILDEGPQNPNVGPTEKDSKGK